MKANLLIGWRTVLTAGLFGLLVTAGSAQFPIPIPSIPKIKKEKKPEPTPAPTPEPEDTSDSTKSSTNNTGETSQPVPKKSCGNDSVYQVYSEDIQKTMDDINSFSPGREYFVRDFNDNQNWYLKAALSESERKQSVEKWDPEFKKCMNQRLDELGALAAKVIGGYTPVGFTLGTPADKAVLRSAVTDINKATVFTVGVKNTSWQIVSNSYGIPEGRKKAGKLWLKYPGAKYCTIVWANIWQDYAGGGTYNSAVGSFIAWEFAGCPPGK